MQLARRFNIWGAGGRPQTLRSTTTGRPGHKRRIVTGRKDGQATDLFGFAGSAPGRWSLPAAARAAAGSGCALKVAPGETRVGCIRTMQLTRMPLPWSIAMALVVDDPPFVAHSLRHWRFCKEAVDEAMLMMHLGVGARALKSQARADDRG